jgi:RNA polymerase sigma-70 factor (ECF subfamily)
MTNREPIPTALGQPTARVQSGSALEEEAFRGWYERTLPRVYAYLLNRCGRNADLAEELTQQTFVDALRSRRGAVASQRAEWMIGVARHKLVDYFRGLERRENGFLRLVAGRPPQSISMDETGPDDRVSIALTRLPAGQRAAVVLRYVDDLPVREVARLLGRSESSAESLLSRARAALRQQLSEDPQ